MNDASDYIWSTWDEAEMRAYLVKHNLIKSKEKATRDELIAKLKGHTTGPAYEMWSDSYLVRIFIKIHNSRQPFFRNHGSSRRT